MIFLGATPLVPSGSSLVSYFLSGGHGAGPACVGELGGRLVIMAGVGGPRGMERAAPRAGLLSSPWGIICLLSGNRHPPPAEQGDIIGPCHLSTSHRTASPESTQSLKEGHELS